MINSRLPRAGEMPDERMIRVYGLTWVGVEVSEAWIGVDVGEASGPWHGHELLRHSPL